MRPFSELPQYYRHLRQEIISVVPADALNILDVGCGAGVLGKALKKQAQRRRVVGIELNDEAFYYAKQNLDAAYNADLETFEPPFIRGEFDCIISADILEHLINPWMVARQYATFLKPDGLMIASIPNIRNLPTLRQLAECGSWEYQEEGILDKTHLRFFTKKEFIKLLNQADIVCESVTYLGGQHLYSTLAKSSDQTVRLGNLTIKDVSHEDLMELCANQLLFVGVYKPESNNSDNPLFPKYRASVVVPWWDHGELLELWKGNIEHLRGSEVIFIDNGSASETKAALQYFCAEHNIRLIRNDENRGFAAANNQGLAVATGEYILHLNNDVEILKPPVEYLCELAKDGFAGPGYSQNELGELYVEGWALCVKKSLLQALEGWPEDYGPGYWEDVDLCHRARLAGYSLTPIPDIDKLIRHQGNATSRDGRIDQLALHIRNRGIFINKYYCLHPKILVDGVFFQLYKTGIARVWKSLLEEWADKGFASHIVVLDRSGTAPKIPGIRYRLVPPYDYGNTDTDREMLQQVCDEEGADLFISTYYTTPLSTPSVFMAYDMIPEVMGWDMNNPMWREKHHGIQQASGYLAISENTARDLVKFFPHISPESVTVSLCGVQRTFSPASLAEVNSFRTKYGISKPYFILVGTGGYKNTILFLQAFAQLHSRHGFDIVCTGSGALLEDEFRAYTSGSVVHMLQLSDEELKAAYSGAVALVYPSKYEGFGLPVLEAMACGCPVITCPNASIPEVAGEAAIYVNDADVNGLANALCDVQKADTRRSLIAAGLEQAKKFSWSKMARTVSYALIDATLLPLKLQDINLIIFPDWSQPEESLCLELERVIRAIATHPDKSRVTLLIDTSNISDEDANLVLSSVTMNLLMQEDLEVTEGPEISLVGKLGEIQWEALLPRIQVRIILENENQQAIAQAKAETLPSYELKSFSERKSEQFFFELSNKLFQEGRWQEAIAQYQKFLEIKTGDADLYWRLSECFRQLNFADKAFSTLQEGIRLYPTEGSLHFSLIINLQRSGRIKEAISSADAASKLLPNDYTFKILKNLIVPIIYDTQDEISFYRQRFIRGLHDLIQQTSLETPEEQKNALAGIGSFTNFYLSYQAHNDIELQRQYGNLMHQIMAANYPKWVAPLSMPPLKENNKIRIGYVSAYLHSYSGTLWLTGWLRHCDRQSFEIYCYYIGNEPDPITQQFQDYSDVFHHIPHNLEAASEQIIAARLHILVFPEIGMNPQTMQMAALRLAPVQCAAWGHPVTSGLPTIDYFLSSELMEPENAQEHYSETLICLPNIGVSYPKPFIPPLIKTRSDFQLRDDAVIYLCCQAPFKYLPQYDFIFAEIARRVSQAQFVFLRGGLLQQRLNRAFAAVGLNSEDYCVFLTIPERLDYLMINLLSDVYLDTFSWSGGNTTLEAIACNLPVVTCPGEFMRGRHSDSFLKMLGVTDTIAENEVEYIEIAVRLGLDPAWRRKVAQRINESHDRLYDDKVCVAGLEAFYKQVVRESLTKTN